MDRITPSIPGQTQTKFGFKINHLERAAYYAIRQAYDWVISARDKGVQIRTWAVEDVPVIDSLTNWAEELQTKQPEGNSLRDEIHMKVGEMGHQEGKILKVIQKYLLDMRHIKTRLNLLNPPLTSFQLQPFLDAVEEDKKRTIAALGVLTSHLETLTKLKLTLYRDLQRLFPE